MTIDNSHHFVWILDSLGLDCLEHQDHYRKKGQKGQKGGNSNCPPKIPGQKMYFAGPDACSIASANMMYLAHDGHIKPAVKGEIIEMKHGEIGAKKRFYIC